MHCIEAGLPAKSMKKTQSSQTAVLFVRLAVSYRPLVSDWLYTFVDKYLHTFMDKYFHTKICVVGNANGGTRAIWVASLFAETGSITRSFRCTPISLCALYWYTSTFESDTCPQYYSGRDALTWCNHVSEQATDHNLYFRSETTVLWPLHT